MSLSVADLDFSRLDDEDHETWELILKPMLDRDAGEAELASELGLDRKIVRARLERLERAFRAQAGEQLPPLSEEEYEALRESIATFGQRYPILVDEETDEIIDGRHRMRICRELGIEPRVERLRAADAAERRSLAFVVNVARRQLTASARGGLVETALKTDPTRSDRAIAVELGVSPTTVGKIRRALEHRQEVSIVDTRTGRDGVAQPVKPKPAPKPETPHEPAPARDRVAAEISGEPIRVHADVPPELIAADGGWVIVKAVRLRHDSGVYRLEVRR